MTSESPKRTPRPKGTAPGVESVSADGLAHGITIAASIVLFLWLGDLLDKRIGTSPLFALLGMFTGAAGGFYRLYLHLVVIPRQQAESRQDDEQDETT